jgi:hypothetical protein
VRHMTVGPRDVEATIMASAQAAVQHQG